MIPDQPPHACTCALGACPDGPGHTDRRQRCPPTPPSPSSLGGPCGLVRDWLRLVSAAGPRVVVWENVHGATLPRPSWPSGLLSYERTTLVRCGYRTRWTELRADQVGLMHRRSRVFLVAVRQSADIQRHAQPDLWKSNTHRGAMSGPDSPHRRTPAPSNRARGFFSVETVTRYRRL